MPPPGATPRGGLSFHEVFNLKKYPGKTSWKSNPSISETWNEIINMFDVSSKSNVETNKTIIAF